MDKIPFDPYDFFGYLATGLAVILGMQLTLGFPQVIGRDLNALELAMVLLATYVAGQLMATPATAVLEDFVVDKILQRPSINLFAQHTTWWRTVAFPGFYKPLPNTIRDKIFNKVHKQHAAATGETLFLLVRYSPQAREDERLLSKLDSFLNKYGFARNLAFTSFVLGLALFVKIRVAWDPELFKYAITAMIVSVLLFYRYLKVFRQYSFEMFNAYGGKTD